MGFYDNEVRNGFDNMFDRDHDGVLNCKEQWYQREYLEKQMESGNSASSDYDDWLDDLDDSPSTGV